MLLIGVAAVIFAAVAWGRLSTELRALLLLGLTAAAFFAAAASRRRGLLATAEALGVLALGLLVIDGFLLHAGDVAGLGSVDGSGYVTVWLASVACVAWAVGSRLDLAAGRVAAALLALVAPLPAAFGHLEPLGVAAVLLGVALVAGPLRQLLRNKVAVGVGRGSSSAAALLTVGAVLGWLAGWGVGMVGAAAPVAEHLSGDADVAAPWAGAATLLFAAAVAVVAWQVGSRIGTNPDADVLSFATAVAAVPALLFPAMVLAEASMSAVLAATASLGTAGFALLLPRAARRGSIVVAALVGGGAMLSLAAPLGAVVAGALSWCGDPWSAASGAASSRDLLAPTAADSGAFDPTYAPLAVAILLVVATVVALIASSAPESWLEPTSVGGAAVAVLLAPASMNLPYAAGLAVMLGAGVACGVVGVLRDRLWWAAPTSVLVALAVAWSLALPAATMSALAVVLVAAATGASYAPLRSARVLLGVAVLGLGGLVLVIALAADWPVARAGFVTAVTGVAVAATGSHLLRSGRREVAEGAGSFVALVGLLVTVATDAEWTGHALVAVSVGAAVVALQPDRRVAGWVSGVALTAALWVYLAAAEVTAPEAYSLLPAAALLVVGWQRRRTAPETSSWSAYGAGLILALVPSLVASLGDPGLLRPLGVGIAGVAVLLIGVRQLLQAPVVVGAAVVAVDAVAQLGPYAAGLPRWVTLGTAGALLLTLGATFERRRRDVQRVSAAFDRLT